jgi:hypothetical protein
MRNVIGIEIKGREIRLVALNYDSGDVKDVTGTYKRLILEDDEIAENVILFKNSLFAVFDSFNPSDIVLKWRNPKPAKGFQKDNNFSSSPISFKIEGLIQLYDKASITLIKPQTITAYFRKYELPFEPKYTYQSDALKIAYHHIKTNY